jgi:ABC-type Na+ efflux pump permease subunit
MIFGGGIWPVVQRELRAATRWRWGPWLRMNGALMGVFIFWVINSQLTGASAGLNLFSRIHILLLWLICTTLPALTADSIARERREGTLGLLFMTPLTASGIVLGKVLTQTLRVLTLWLALVPLLTIPFLYGGITWPEVAVFLTIELCTGMLCLAAGMLASSLTNSRALAFIAAFLLMGAFVGGSRRFIYWSLSGSNPNGFNILTPYVNAVFFGGPIPLRAGHQPGVLMVEYFTIAAVVLWASLRFAGWRVERSWQDNPPSVRRQNWVKRYGTPLFARWFAGRMKRSLDRNPIAWLQQYSWKARVSKWGLCLLFVVLECAAIDGARFDVLEDTLTGLLLVLAAAYTFAGVNGFIQEKQSGALELILISPLTVNQIVFGRVWGLWKQFLPSIMVVVGSDIAIQAMLPSLHYPRYNYFERGHDWLLFKDLEIVAIYLTLPVIATCFALSARNLLAASALTALMGFGPAFVLRVAAGLSSLYDVHTIQFYDVPRLVVTVAFLAACIILFHAVIAWRAYLRLRRYLSRDGKMLEAVV